MRHLKNKALRVGMRNAQWATQDAGIEEADGYRGAVPDHYKAYVEHLEYLASQPPVQEPEKTIELVDPHFRWIRGCPKSAGTCHGGYSNRIRGCARNGCSSKRIAGCLAPAPVVETVVAVEPTPEPVVVVKKKMGRPRKQAAAE